MVSVYRIVALVVGLTAVGCGPQDSEKPRTEATGADVELQPASASVLQWTMEEKRAGFPNYDQIFQTRFIPASDHPYPLPENLRDISGLQYEVGGEVFGLEDFKAHNHVAGLLAIQDGEIVVEQYANGNDRWTKWVSYSVTKSVVSMLVGAAIEEGFIGGVDDLVTDYVRPLVGSGYDEVTLRHALWMASGLEWNEDYADPESDVARGAGMTTLERLAFLGGKPRVAAPGERFNYNTGETHLVGGVVRSAIGNNLSTYLSAKIWEPFGMESDANWLILGEGGPEHGGCCISATLRDYGRIGLFALHDGVLPDGTRVLPEGWMAESTTPSPGSEGYGYLWWLRGGGVFNAIGIFGQTIWIDPSENLVMVTHGMWPQATGREFSEHRAAFFPALTELLREGR